MVPSMLRDDSSPTEECMFTRTDHSLSQQRQQRLVKQVSGHRTYLRCHKMRFLTIRDLTTDQREKDI